MESQKRVSQVTSHGPAMELKGVEVRTHAHISHSIKLQRALLRLMEAVLVQSMEGCLVSR